MNQFLSRYEKLGVIFDPELVVLRPSFRVNTLKISIADLLSRLEKKGVIVEKIPFLANGFFYSSDFSLSSSEEYLLGYIYIQEAASMLPPEVLVSDLDLSNLSDDFKVLDLCAAPGSKTTQLAALFKDGVPIFALDDVAPRLDKLHDNLVRLGISSVVSIRKDGQYVDDLSLSFDRILLDAPCSGNFCIDKDFFSKRSVLMGVRDNSFLQLKLLKAAWRVLKPGGVLIYSTCSLEPEEDELVIDEFLSLKGDADLLPIDLSVGSSGLTEVFANSLDSRLSLTRRLWPHESGTEGFFLAKLVKKKD